MAVELLPFMGFANPEAPALTRLEAQVACYGLAGTLHQLHTQTWQSSVALGEGSNLLRLHHVVHDETEIMSERDNPFYALHVPYMVTLVRKQAVHLYVGEPTVDNPNVRRFDCMKKGRVNFLRNAKQYEKATTHLLRLVAEAEQSPGPDAPGVLVGPPEVEDFSHYLSTAVPLGPPGEDFV